MVDVRTRGALEKGAVPLETTNRHADRIDIGLGVPIDAGPAERLAALVAAVHRELDGFVDVLPSQRLRPAEAEELRALLGGDAALEDGLRSVLAVKDDLHGFVDFLLVLRVRVYATLADRPALAQADVDEALLAVARAWAPRLGYAGVRTITDREPSEVFTASVRRGELQYDAYFRGQLFEITRPPGINIHGHLPHVLQWLYYAWRHAESHSDDPRAAAAVAGVYRRVPDVRSCEMFRRLSDTLNSSVQLELREGEPPNFTAIAVNYRGLPTSVTDPAAVTRLYELVFYHSLDPARPVALEPLHVMVAVPGAHDVRALYRPETDAERREWASELAAHVGRRGG